MKFKINYCKIIKKTLYGPVAILWNYIDDNPIIFRVILSQPQISAKEYVKIHYPNINHSSLTLIDKIALKVKRFLDGENVTFNLEHVALYNCSKFQQKVLRAEYQIPWGSISTYQHIAQYIGRDKAARAVGNALAQNPFPIIIPCHRAIRSDGTLGGFQGGLDMKQALLENEGIIFKKGKVFSPPFFY